MTKVDNKFSKELQKDLDLGNIHQVPKLEKVVISVGLGRAKDDKRLMEVADNTIKKITGQAPVVTIARKSVAGFKLREGNKIGLKTTLRGSKMHEFVERFVNIVLPRLRDFHGVKASSFDAMANYNVGLADQSVFPELSYDETTVSHGVQITFVTTTSDKTQSKSLLQKLGMPFEKEAVS